MGRLGSPSPASVPGYLLVVEVRPAQPQWSFNLYTMIHGKNPEDCRRTAQKISKETGIRDYRLLFSKREHKKSSMRYFGRR